MVRNTARKINRYLELVNQFPLRPLHTERELDRATEIIHTLVGSLDHLDDGERDYLDVLSDLVEKYELEHHPIEDVSDVELLQHLIESKNASQRQVAGGAGISVSTLFEIMAGRRRMNRSHIEKLSALFNVEPSVFLPRIPSRRKRTSASELLDEERGRR